MKIAHEDYDQLSVLTIRGDLTLDHTEALKSAAMERLARQTRDFVLDITAMDFIDSKGLEMLLWLQEQAGERLGQIRLAGKSDNVAKILEMTRLANRFDSHPDLEAAIKSLR